MFLHFTSPFTGTSMQRASAITRYVCTVFHQCSFAGTQKYSTILGKHFHDSFIVLFVCRFSRRATPFRWVINVFCLYIRIHPLVDTGLRPFHILSSRVARHLLVFSGVRGETRLRIVLCGRSWLNTSFPREGQRSNSFVLYGVSQGKIPPIRFGQNFSCSGFQTKVESLDCF